MENTLRIQKAEKANRLLFSAPGEGGKLVFASGIARCLADAFAAARNPQSADTASAADYLNALCRELNDEMLDAVLEELIFSALVELKVLPAELQSEQWSENTAFLLEQAKRLLDGVGELAENCREELFPRSAELLQRVSAPADLKELAERLLLRDRFRRNRAFQFHNGRFVPVELTAAKPIAEFYGFPSVRAQYENHFADFAAGKSNLPLLVYYDGAGPSLCSEYFMCHCSTADKYLPGETAHLAIFTHPYRPPKTRKEHETIHKEYRQTLDDASSYWNSGLEKGIEHTFFYRAILGAVRMCNIVSAMPEFDKEHISFLGTSQGGGFGIFITALCPQINAVCSGVPAFCDCGGFLAGHHPTTSENTELRKHYNLMRYFDPANFAPMIKVPVYMSCGFIDITCQPSGIYAVFNELHGNKMMFHKTIHGHADGTAEYTPLFWFWTGCHLGLCNK
jgi:hypothetical protein